MDCVTMTRINTRRHFSDHYVSANLSTLNELNEATNSVVSDTEFDQLGWIRGILGRKLCKLVQDTY